jgi:hypothetical protein
MFLRSKNNFLYNHISLQYSNIISSQVVAFYFARKKVNFNNTESFFVMYNFSFYTTKISVFMAIELISAIQ